VTRPLFDPALLDAIEGSVEHDFEAIVWRQIVAGTDPLNTNSLGGRWNPPGVEVLYCSLSERGAELELAALLDRQPTPVKRHRVTHKLKVRLAKVARLTESEAFAAAGVRSESVLSEDMTLSRRVGAAAEWLGMGGMIVPSARHTDGNLVIITNRLVAPQNYYELVED
jgi:RES domain-containing protein